MARLLINDRVRSDYADVLTADALGALEALRPFERRRQEVMAARLARRAERARERRRIRFLDPDAFIPGTTLRVADVRAGRFEGGAIPHDLERQWIQGTGPAAKPNSTVAKSIRNIAHALLSGADGWMFDGEDALGQIRTMSLDNQRNLRLAIHQAPEFLAAAEQVAAEMNAWSKGFFGRPIVNDWRRQLAFTTKIFRPRGLHLDDRHLRDADGRGFSASIVDAALYVVSNHRRLREDGSSLVLYLPKIQTAEEAALWHALLAALEHHLGMASDAIRTYVLIEQVEASFQLMEIRSALGRRFVGFNTGRWDYINSVADAMAWDPAFINPNIDAITMTYGYMRAYEDRVRRAVNTPDANGRFALWQGGMEPNIPVGSPAGVDAAMKRAVAGAEREQQAGASGKWVAHWKMVHIVRPVWERAGEVNQLGREFPPLTYSDADADALLTLEPAPRTIRGARDLLSVGLQYSNAFGQGMQAAALKPADFFADDDVLYLMEDMATAEIRLSILWEWIHKNATVDNAPLTMDRFDGLLSEEYGKLVRADNRDVHDDSKATTLPIARAIVERYVKEPAKLPWFIDLLNLTLDTYDMTEASHRIDRLALAFRDRGVRLTSLVLLVLAAALGCNARSSDTSPAPQPQSTPTAAARTTLMAGMGDHHHPITTASADAQKFFDEGMALVFAFNHDEAVRSFRRAAELDPKAAMPQWGIAWALGPNYNLDIDDPRSKQASDAIAAAQALSQNAPEHERAYIAAMAGRYSPDPNADRPALARKYADAMRALSARYPDDLDAATLYAESLMNLRPWRLWTLDGKPADGTDEILRVLESVLARNPSHIGANHYYIHSVEASPRPGLALASAKRLETLVPAAGHLVHMPAHIYARTGDHAAAARANLAGAEADREYLKTAPPATFYEMAYYSHNLHFLADSHMMQGRFDDALRAARDLADRLTPHAAMMPMIESMAVAPMSVLMRFGRHEETLKLEKPAVDRPVMVAWWHFARTVALARLGRIDEAVTERAAFDAAARNVPESALFGGTGLESARTVLTVAAAVADARISWARGQRHDSIASWRQAVDLADRLPYDEPPVWFYPIRESLGAALLQAGRAADAEAVFREDLLKHPRNPRSLFGLNQSLLAQKRDADAAWVQRSFDEVWKNADSRLTIDSL